MELARRLSKKSIRKRRRRFQGTAIFVDVAMSMFILILIQASVAASPSASSSSSLPDLDSGRSDDYIGGSSNHDNTNVSNDDSHSVNYNYDSTPESKFNNHQNDGAGIVQMNLHPASTWIRHLYRQLELMDSAITETREKMEEASESNTVHGVDDRDGDYHDKANGEKEHHMLLRHLQQDQQLHRPTKRFSFDEFYSEQEQKHLPQRQLLKQQIEKAMASLQGTGAAYASVMEFSSDILLLDQMEQMEEWDFDQTTTTHPVWSTRRLKELLVRHNEAIQEYNEYYRHYSKYEWALREGRGEDDVDGARYTRYLKPKSDSEMNHNPKAVKNHSTAESSTATTSPSDAEAALPLIGTNWKAI